MSTEICTSIEQSKKLLSLDLDPSTADMWWSRCTITDFGDNDLKVSYAVTPCNISQFKNTDKDIPCWSFTALLELMPIGSHIEKKNSGYACYVVYTKPLEASTPIEAAFEMICWLIKQGHIKVKK
jgi:hypothetical protein